MTISRAIAVATAATVLLPILVLAQELEKKVQRSDLPPAVEKTVVEQSKGATIRGFSEEKENGQTFYETELMVNGHFKDVLVDVNGSVVEVEEQVSIESLPAAVRRGLQDKAGNGKFVKVEKLTKKDKLVAYEAKSPHQWKKVRGSGRPGRETFRPRGIMSAWGQLLDSHPTIDNAGISGR